MSLAAIGACREGGKRGGGKGWRSSGVGHELGQGGSSQVLRWGMHAELRDLAFDTTPGPSDYPGMHMGYPCDGKHVHRTA